MQAIVIGTDIPDITAELLDQAVKALEQYEVLLVISLHGIHTHIQTKLPTLLNKRHRGDKQVTCIQCAYKHLHTSTCTHIASQYLAAK